MTIPEENKITMNLKILTFIMTVIVSAFGFFITRTLDSIDNNISELKQQLEKRSEIINSHETRLGIHDTRINLIEHLLKKGGN